MAEDFLAVMMTKGYVSHTGTNALASLRMAELEAWLGKLDPTVLEPESIC